MYATARRQRADNPRSERYAFISRLGYPTTIIVDIDWMRSQPAGTTASRIGPVIRWLSEDPFCLNSGYRKQTAMRLLRRFNLSSAQADAVRGVILDVLTRGKRQEFSELVRLAAKLDSPGFRSDLEALMSHSDVGTAERAMRVLARCRRNDVT
jgi:hypothetical protein